MLGLCEHFDLMTVREVCFKDQSEPPVNVDAPFGIFCELAALSKN